MFDALQVYDDCEPKSAALNMAVDEVLVAEAAVPVIRFYRWRQPSLSFGYFGRYTEVAHYSGAREIVRRWTGGGVVPHGEDVTYSVIIPKAHPFFARSSLEIYADVHDAIRRALAANQIESSLIAGSAPRVSEDCFANAVRADVMSKGRKIAGAAHRRSRSGLLHQGSIQLPALPERFRKDFAHALCQKCETSVFAPEVMNRAVVIAATKYGTEEWLKRR